ncbi:hypothetical protein GCM10010406_45760 [Streptomyces thermolineatus]|uniref:Uncharacterized protein n=1 Tax=Streptomyces thermolineatus TaxID=44033 RepID=A0ABN3MPJ8_9ACTN
MQKNAKEVTRYIDPIFLWSVVVSQATTALPGALRPRTGPSGRAGAAGSGPTAADGRSMDVVIAIRSSCRLGARSAPRLRVKGIGLVGRGRGRGGRVPAHTMTHGPSGPRARA